MCATTMSIALPSSEGPTGSGPSSSSQSPFHRRHTLCCFRIAAASARSCGRGSERSAAFSRPLGLPRNHRLVPLGAENHTRAQSVPHVLCGDDDRFTDQAELPISTRALDRAPFSAAGWPYLRKVVAVRRIDVNAHGFASQSFRTRSHSRLSQSSPSGRYAGLATGSARIASSLANASSTSR